MKATIYIGILSVLILATSSANAQYSDNGNYGYSGAGQVVNNYYVDQDYYFSSRINRFHRSFAAFDYYSPVFTDTYWYSYQPYSWGMSIYGRSGFSIGYSINYPVYYDWGYSSWYGSGWYDPYYGSSWGYDPFYYSWYAPTIINININRWPRYNHGWNSHNSWYYGYRPVYNTYNYYNYYDQPNRYYSRDYNSRSSNVNRTSLGGESRREASVPVSRSSNARPDSRTTTVSDESRRSSSEVTNRTEVRTGNSTNSRESNPTMQNRTNQNNGNNLNSRENGNSGNFEQRARSYENSGNNTNSRENGNSGNAVRSQQETRSITAPREVPVQRSNQQSSQPANTYNSNTRTERSQSNSVPANRPTVTTRSSAPEQRSSTAAPSRATSQPRSTAAPARTTSQPRSTAAPSRSSSSGSSSSKAQSTPSKSSSSSKSSTSTKSSSSSEGRRR